MIHVDKCLWSVDVQSANEANSQIGCRRTLAQLRAIKINDQNTYIKMYELQSICELCRSLSRLSSRMPRVSRDARFTMTHPLVRPLIASSSFVVSFYYSTVPTRSLPFIIIIIICYECNFMCSFSFCRCCAKKPQAAQTHKKKKNETQSSAHELESSVPRRQIQDRKGANIDIFIINFIEPTQNGNRGG